MPKFSIITVCKNSEQTIERTICSVAEQNFKDYEYIIVDGASTDKTLELAKKYKRHINKIISEPDTGIYEAMNKGIKLTQGEYLLFLNAGDLFLHENILDIACNELQKNSSDVFYGNVLVLDNKTGRAYIKRIGLTNRRKLFTYTIPHQAAFVARTAFIKAGYYDETLRIAADYDWFLRAILKYKCTYRFYDFICSIFYTDGISNAVGEMPAQVVERKLVQKRYYNFIERKFYNNYISRKIVSLGRGFIDFCVGCGLGS
ncbi:glycosyl transferase GTA-type super family [Candidatus Termititenax aidoneus]|uniref:Glycosyl transferase GTA-type super family n=1 Tax=Termititenax aidoneus TaxID=2218524 RepID=A0A388TBH9_TERA1|nr:glycosyl transferase GTA-type super family [Candidatus Termititenax aidoneus]